ncbi:hypothetical protein RvY_14994-2 [Ramazzottius varieornatus]|uniref:Attacin C-terminal domain-containing protein n=1 Tax=Ramazzottius varieornatus TaxID=947166 RepID=A0A1D1VT92_RAMVA|nr:hypothetical protein RvY_14994-2 [Ramazzottius varieornatus]
MRMGSLFCVLILIMAASAYTEGRPMRAKRDIIQGTGFGRPVPVNGNLNVLHGLPDASGVQNSNMNMAAASHAAMHSHDTNLMHAIGHHGPSTDHDDQADILGSHISITH